MSWLTFYSLVSLSSFLAYVLYSFDFLILYQEGNNGALFNQWHYYLWIVGLSFNRFI